MSRPHAFKPLLWLVALGFFMQAGLTHVDGSTVVAFEAFHSTFICVGLMTSAAAWILAQLPADEPHREAKAEPGE